ncbi:MAG: KEOPS complex subunit Pcc1 [Sulfolobus sp.]
MRVSIRVESNNASVIAKSVEVDNIDLPIGMEIVTRNEGSEIVVVVTMEIKNPSDIMTLRNTVDEILQHINTLEKTLSTVK